jgi:hypothetical protein
MSKGYTINYFVNVFTNTTNTQIARNGVYNTVSPRNGYASVKAGALDRFLQGQTYAIANGTGVFASFGKTPRARLLKALRNRKRYGTVA